MLTHPEPPWIPYSPGEPVPMGMVRQWSVMENPTDYYPANRMLWNMASHYQRHSDHQLISDMRDELCDWLSDHNYDDDTKRALILRAEAIVGRAPGLPGWLVEYLDGGKE